MIAPHITYVEDSLTVATADRYIGQTFMVSASHTMMDMQHIATSTVIAGNECNLHMEALHIQLPSDIDLKHLCVQRLPYNFPSRIDFVISGTPGKKITHLKFVSSISSMTLQTNEKIKLTDRHKVKATEILGQNCWLFPKSKKPVIKLKWRGGVADAGEKQAEVEECLVFFFFFFFCYFVLFFFWLYCTLFFLKKTNKCNVCMI